MPLRRAEVQRPSRHRAQVRHVLQPPRRRGSSGVCAGLSERGHPHHQGANEHGDHGVSRARENFSEQRPRRRLHAADHALCHGGFRTGRWRYTRGRRRDRTPTTTRALAAGGDAGVVTGVRGRGRNGSAGPPRKPTAAPALAGPRRGRTGVQRLPSRPPVRCLARVLESQALLDEPGDCGVRPVPTAADDGHCSDVRSAGLRPGMVH